MSTAPLKLVGAHGSPYSRKMRAVLRYRRIPFRWILRGSAQDVGIPEVPVALIPVLVFPGAGGAGDEAMIDSTPQIRRLEQLYSERRVIHPDPVVALLDSMIEDYADEWVTKVMFHYRWAYPPDVRKASEILPLDRDITAHGEELARLSKAFAERQVGRLAVVGSNETTKPIIEQSYRRLLTLLDAHLQVKPFLMGGRPGASDFGLFGQLSQLALFDPTSSAVAASEAPRVIAWLHHVEDLGSLEVSEADWTPRARREAGGVSDRWEPLGAADLSLPGQVSRLAPRGSHSARSRGPRGRRPDAGGNRLRGALRLTDAAGPLACAAWLTAPRGSLPVPSVSPATTSSGHPPGPYRDKRCRYPPRRSRLLEPPAEEP
jgi:glutathione S-transferase